MILRLLLPRIYYYQNKQLLVKESQYLITTYSWILTPIPNPNTQLDLFYSDNLSFSMHVSQYVTNQFDVRITVCSLLTNLRKMLATKFFSSSHDEDHETHWLQNPTMYKRSNFFKKKMN